MKFVFSLILSLMLAPTTWAQTKNIVINVGDDHNMRIQTQYTSYNFGRVPVNGWASANLTLRNVGGGPLWVNGIDIWGTGFSGWNQCPQVLYPGYYCNTRVDFRPWHRGEHTGHMTYWLNPGGNIYVDLYGWGADY